MSLDVLAASRLPSADLGGTSDPYVVATLSGTSLGKVKKEWPPELRSQGDRVPSQVEKAADRLLTAMEAYDHAGPNGGVNLREFTEVILNSDVAEALLVSEFAAQIVLKGVACVKVSPTNAVFNFPTRVAFRDSSEGSALCYLKKAKVWSRLPVEHISRVEVDAQKPHVVRVQCGKKEACFNLANPFYAGALAHVIEECLKREELRISLAEQVSPSGRVSGTPSKAVAGAVKETSSGTFAKGAKTAIRQTTVSELPTGDKY